MERRDFLKAGTVAGGAGIGGLLSEGCAHQADARERPLVREMDAARVEAFVDRLDRRMAWISQSTLPADLLPPERSPKTPEAKERFARDQELARKALRVLYLTGSFMDLGEVDRLHPAVQARVAAAQPEMDEAVLGLTAFLEQATPETLKRVQTKLRQDPDLGMRIAAFVERPAVEDGLGFTKRMNLRASFGQLSARMRAQSPSLVIDPCVRKVRRMAGELRAEDDGQRKLRARIGEAAFWEHHERMTRIVAAWDRHYAQEPSGTAPAAPAVPPETAAPGTTAAPETTAPPAAAQSSPATPQPAPATLQPPPVPRANRRWRLESNDPHASSRRMVSHSAYILGFGLSSLATGGFFFLISELTGAELLVAPAVVLGVTVGPLAIAIGLLVLLGAGIAYLHE